VGRLKLKGKKERKKKKSFSKKKKKKKKNLKEQNLLGKKSRALAGQRPVFVFVLYIFERNKDQKS
jgi:tRNA splicing endonuclease